MPGTYQYDVEIKSNVAKLLSDMKQVQDRLDTVEGKEYKIKLNVDEKKLSSVISNLEKMLDSLGKGTGDFKQFENLSKELSSIISEVQSLSKAFGKVDDSGANTLLSSIQNIDKSLSELSQNILNVNKNMSNMGGNTSGAVKQVENITNESKKAKSALDDVTKSQAKLNNNTTKQSIEFNTESLEEIKSLFANIESSLSSIKSVLVDVGDGEELSPLLKTIDNINTSIINLSSSIKNIGLNMNIDVGTNSESEAKIQSKMSNALQAYQRLFEHIKMSSVGGSAITDKFFQFDINQFDSMMSKIQAYKKFIENMRNETKTFFGGKDIIYNDTEKKYWTQAASAMGQLTKAQNELNKTNNTNPLDNLFKNSEDLSGVIEQLTIIVGKLDEISNSAKEFSNIFKTGLNVHASTEEVEKLTAKVKELESELSKIKANTTTPLQESNISSGMKDTFPKTSENLEQVAQSEQKVQQEAVATDKALDNISFTPNTEGFDDIIAKFGILREQAEQITKIVKTTKQTVDGTNISYKATLRNGSSYYLGENSTPQVLNASETVYDSNAIEKAYQEATKVNNALNETNSLLSSLKIPNGFEGSFSTLESEIKRLNSEFGSGKISATEYANSIKKVFSNYQTPIDNKSKDIWNDLTTSLDRYATLQKRIASNNALSTDNEEATKLLEHIHELQRSDILPTEKLTASNEKLQQINQTVTDLKAKLKESTLDSLQGSIDKYQKIYNQRNTYSSDFTPSEQYTKNLTELNTAIGKLVEYKDTLKNVSKVTVEQEAHLKGLVAVCEKASDSFKSLSASEKGTSQIGIDKLVQRINKDLDENTNYSKRAKLGLRALRDELESANPRNLKEITSEIIKIENAEIRAGRAGKSFFDIFKTKGMYSFIGQMQSYLSMYIGFYGVMNKIKRTISTVKELDTALVDLKKTTTMNTTQLNEFYYSANNVARQMGVTTEEIINQASAWSRLGYSSKESASEMAKLSSQFASISPGMDIDTATDGLVSTMKAFDVSVDEVQRNIMDNINKIGNTAATSNSEIVDMLTRSSAAMAAANNTLEETIALETAAVEITRSSESTGTAFKTLSMRLRGYDEETESYTGDVEELSGAIADLTKTASTPGGISLFTDDTKQTYKSTYQLLKEISEIWDQLSDKDQAQLLEKLAGKRGGQVVAGLLSNFSAATKAMKDMGEAAGSSDAEMGIIEQSIEYKLNNLKEIWVGTAQSIAKRDSLGGAIDALSKLSEGIGFVIKNFGLLKTAAIGLTGYLSFKNVGGSKMYDLILF